MLRDLMYCGHCGSHIAGRKKKAKYENFYYCPKKERDWKNNPPAEEEKWKRGRGCSMTRSLNIDATDKLVWNTVKYAVTKAMFEDVPDFNEVLRSIKEKEQKSEAEVKETNRKIEKHKRELRQIRNQIADVETQILLGRKEGDIGDRIIENLEAEHNRVQEEIEQLEMNSKMSSNTYESLLNAGKSFQHTLKKSNNFENLTPQEKKDYLTKIIDTITVYWDEEKAEHQLKIDFILKNFNDNLPFGGIVKSKDLDATLKKKTLKDGISLKNHNPPTVQTSHARIITTMHQRCF
tara:strand:- start:708 stop:1583 length:876 start_codon:yes stop_codon:yes gene_type:complete